MIDLMPALVDIVVFVAELGAVVFGSLFLVLVAAEIAAHIQAGRERGR